MIKVNLLRPEKKERVPGAETASILEEIPENRISLPALIAAIVITIGVFGFLFFSQSSTLDREQKTLEERKAHKAELDQTLKKLQEVEKTKLLLDSKIKIINDLKRQQKNTVFMMDKLSRSLPDWVWLTSLSFSGAKLNIDGKALSNNLIADFIIALQNTNYFTEIRLLSSIRRKEAGTEIFEFKIDCQFRRLDGKVV